MEGRFGRGIRNGVGEALSQFVALIRDPEAGRGRARGVRRRSAAASCARVARSIRLQAAYRVGARVAWRRIAAAGQRAELDAAALSLLAEAIFAYIDELSADSVEGYAEAQSEGEDLRRRRQRELALLLTGEPRRCHRRPARRGTGCGLEAATQARRPGLRRSRSAAHRPAPAG